VSILSVAEAQATIQSHIPVLPAEQVGLRELAGCVLAQPIIMERDQPPFDRVTMDGIAINTRGINASRRFRIAATQAAGDQPKHLPSDSDCIEVMTGAALPSGCDCVIPVERLQRDADQVAIDDNLQCTAWMNIHRKGSDARQGSTLLHPGQALSAADIAVIASAGYAQVSVRRSPRIALVSTGDELIEPGQPIQDWQVRRSNTYALHAALQQHGHRRLTDAHIADDLKALRTRLGALLADNDVLILSGGVSMGKFDFIPQVLDELHVRCEFHKVAQRPGKPMWFGVRDDGKTVYALPGNPVSTFMCLHRYVLPGLQQAMGRVTVAPEGTILLEAAKGHDELSVFLPVKLQTQANGVMSALPRPTRGSGDFISLLDTDGFVELPPTTSMIAAGSAVPLFRW
jgi:molybdopterin molybdotransferase